MTTMDWLWILLLTPLVTGVLAWRVNTKNCAWLQLAGATIMLIAGLSVVYHVVNGPPFTAWDQMLYVENLY